jgi:hypothetical protein
MTDYKPNLPWRVETDFAVQGIIVDASGEEVASFSDLEDCEITVKAVNHHEVGFNALMMLDSIFDFSDTAGRQPVVQEAYAKAKAAIDAALADGAQK